MKNRSSAYLVLEVIPPVRPGLLNTSLLLDDSPADDSAENAERHGHAMIIVAMHTNAILQLRNGLANDLQAIIQFVRLNAEFRCRIIQKMAYQS